jgi:hypothetical protein
MTMRAGRLHKLKQGTDAVRRVGARSAHRSWVPIVCFSDRPCRTNPRRVPLDLSLGATGPFRLTRTKARLTGNRLDMHAACLQGSVPTNDDTCVGKEIERWVRK